MRIVVFFFILCCSCNKKDIDPLIPASKELKLDWKVSLAEDNHFTLTSNFPILLEEEIVFFYDATSNEKLLIVKKSGEEFSRRTDLFSGDVKFACVNGEGGMLANDYKNLFKIKSSREVQRLCTAPATNQFNVRNNLIGEYLYMHGKGRTDNSGYVYKVNKENGNITLDKKLTPADFPGSEEIVLYSPTYYTTNMNDTIFNYSLLINYKDSSVVTNQIILKKNETILWNDTSNLSFLLQSCIINDNNNVISFGNELNSFESLTGKLNWEFKIPSEWGYYGGPNSIQRVGNRVYLIINGRLVGVNISSGLLEFETPKLFTTTTESRISFFEGVFYFTALDNQSHSCIFGIRESDGKVVIHQRSPNSGIKPYFFDTNFRYCGLQIDPVTWKGYTSDGFFAMCFSIPEKY